MSPITKRLWGSDVIAALYGLIGCLLLGSVFRFDGPLRAVLVVVVVLTFIVSIGLFFRVNAIRVGFMGLLATSLFLDILIMLVLLVAIAGWIELPVKLNLSNQLTRSFTRWLLTAGTLIYLFGSDVRAEYVRKRSVAVESDEFAESEGDFGE